MVIAIERPDTRRSEVEAVVEIIVNDWLYSRFLADWASIVPREGVLIVD